MLNNVILTTVALVAILVPLVVLAQPSAAGAGVRVIVVVGLLGAVTGLINRRGHTSAASWMLVLGIIALLTFNALTGGGIRTPGVRAYFIFVMLAGLLVDFRAGVKVAILCAGLGLGLVVLEEASLISGAETYNAPAHWLLSCVYMGVALLTMRMATRTVESALDRANSELRERRAVAERFEQALEAGAIGFYETDLQRRVIKGDHRLHALFGLAPRPDGTIALDDWLALVHPEDRSRVTGALGRMISGEPKVRIGYRILRPDGAERFLEAAGYLRVEEDGRPASLVGMIIDVTERRLAERERRRLLGDLGERVKELRLLHDVSDLLRARRSIDASLFEDLVAMMPPAWMHPELARARVSFRDVHAASADWRDTPWRLTAPFATSSGSGTIEIAYAEAPPSAGDDPFLPEERELLDSVAQLLRAHIEDRSAETQRRGLEAQLREAQKMEALGTMASGIAHDFNNILTAIGGHSELARGELQADHPAQKNVAEITKAYGRARDLVRRILLFSRREESKRDVTSVRAVIEEVLHLLRASLPKNVEVRTSFADDVPAVLADSSQLHQVMMNLGTNAGYAMREHGGVLTVELDVINVGDITTAPSADLRDGPTVRWRVRDTGSGMSADVLQRLFEPFYTTKGSAGTGLGLSVVHGIVKDHGGAITVHSEVGKGTEFTIFLPEAILKRRESPQAATGPVRGNGQRILCVDDEETLAFLMGRVLSRLGYRCREFTDVQVALQEFRTAPHDFDAVISDLQMPGMSGIEFARAVRAIRPDVPIALVSGVGNSNPEAARAAGISTWINKPSSVDEMSRAVHGMFSA